MTSEWSYRLHQRPETTETLALSLLLFSSLHSLHIHNPNLSEFPFNGSFPIHSRDLPSPSSKLSLSLLALYIYIYICTDGFSSPYLVYLPFLDCFVSPSLLLQNSLIIAKYNSFAHLGISWILQFPSFL